MLASQAIKEQIEHEEAKKRFRLAAACRKVE
jgi:hypothetical protein